MDKPLEREKEMSVINQLTDAHGITGSNPLKPVLDKIAQGDLITDDERERLHDIPRRPKATTKLGPEPLPIPTVPGEITSDVTGKIDTLRADIQNTASAPVDLPSSINKAAGDPIHQEPQGVLSRLKRWFSGK